MIFCSLQTKALQAFNTENCSLDITNWSTSDHLSWISAFIPLFDGSATASLFVVTGQLSLTAISFDPLSLRILLEPVGFQLVESC